MMKKKEKKFKERSNAYHWSTAVGIVAAILMFTAFLVVFIGSKIEADGGCEFEDIEWVVNPGAECWLYDTFDQTYDSKEGWVNEGSPKYCPLPKKIVCKGDVSLPSMSFVKMLSN